LRASLCVSKIVDSFCLEKVDLVDFLMGQNAIFM